MAEKIEGGMGFGHEFIYAWTDRIGWVGMVWNDLGSERNGSYWIGLDGMVWIGWHGSWSVCWSCSCDFVGWALTTVATMMMMCVCVCECVRCDLRCKCWWPSYHQGHTHTHIRTQILWLSVQKDILIRTQAIGNLWCPPQKNISASFFKPQKPDSH